MKTSCLRLFVYGVLGLSLWATRLPARDYFVYFGTYTNALSRGIYVSRLDADTGKLSAPQLAAAVENPNYVCISPNGKYLYSSSSVNHPIGSVGGLVSAFAIAKTSGQLTLLSQEPAGGNDTCYVSVDATGRTLLAANYDNGSVISLPIKADGSLGNGGSYLRAIGHGPNPTRQTGPHAHFIATDPANQFALECDLGLDHVTVYRLNPALASLLPHRPQFVTVPPGSGPRHLVFSRDGHHVYVVNEMGCTVTEFDWDGRTGALTNPETVSVLPPGVPLRPDYTAAEILLSPDGRFLYVSLREHNSVSVMSVNPYSGRLTFVQNVPSGGKLPRGLGLDPTGHWLITGHQKSDNAVEFAVDPQTGKLTPTGTELHLGAPVDVKFTPAN
jgi:6-phosphogluconolactonase